MLLLAEAVEIGTVRRIDRLEREVGKILFQSRFVRPRLRQDKSGDIPRIVRGQQRIQIVRALRHVGMHEIGRVDQAIHAGAVVERFRSPQRRDDVAKVRGRQTAENALSIGVVAALALRNIDRATTRRIGGDIELGNFSGAESRQPLLWRHAGRQEFDVGDESLHFGCIRRQGTAVHAARHAGIHAILDRNLGASPRAVVRKVAVEPKDRQTEFLRPGFEMTVAARQIVAGKALRRIGDLRTDMRVCRGDQIAATPHQSAIIIVRQRADLGHRPDRVIGWRRGLGMNHARHQSEDCNRRWQGARANFHPA